MTILEFCEKHKLDRRLAYRYLGRGDYVMRSEKPCITEQGEKKLREKFKLKRRKKRDTQLSFV